MRVSQAITSGKNRLQYRKKFCQEYTKHKGLQIIGIYADMAKSGTSAECEEFQRMIRDSKEKNFPYLIVHKLDRFSRDKYASVIYKRKLSANGVKIISVVENLDDLPESIMLESVFEEWLNTGKIIDKK
ncbi:MAG: recombinase family protein [Synergistaceae bacterium]|nr:recombinase family protein [Synergistaceae bacterium]